MSSRLEALIEAKAPSLKEFWFDVDGVMTPQGPVTIFDVVQPDRTVHFERSDGIVGIKLVPCDEHGCPIPHTVEYIAGNIGESIMEGYRFDTRDGKVIEYLVANGFSVYFISGRNSACVRKRALALGAVPLLGVKDKLAIIKEMSKCSLEDVLFIGDGIQDRETLQVVGVAIAPADASADAIEVAHCTTTARGGEGVLSEVLTIFLKHRGLWPS